MFLSFIILVDRAVDAEVSLTFQISDIYPRNYIVYFAIVGQPYSKTDLKYH